MAREYKQLRIYPETLKKLQDLKERHLGRKPMALILEEIVSKEHKNGEKENGS